MVLSIPGSVMLPVLIIGLMGIAIYSYSVITSIRLVSQNQMSGTVVGRLITVLSISWALAGMTATLFGLSWYLEIKEVEHIFLVAIVSCLPWIISSYLTLTAVRKWEKEAA